MLVYTPHGNVQAVGTYLSQGGLHLEHPIDPDKFEHHCRLRHYINPHATASPHPLMQQPHSRWTQPSGNVKSVEVQRNQVEELYKNLHNGDELAETEPGACTHWTGGHSCFIFNPFLASQIATQLYPHQKKALTFLLEREREQAGPNGKFSSLWQQGTDVGSRQRCWIHTVTEKRVFEEPEDCKGAILADDVSMVCFFRAPFN
jgi:SWI/SNF-related matrix-associated actin-dependent regulator of chromatin subfamily A3